MRDGDGMVWLWQQQGEGAGGMPRSLSVSQLQPMQYSIRSGIIHFTGGMAAPGSMQPQQPQWMVRR